MPLKDYKKNRLKKNYKVCLSTNSQTDENKI